MDNASPDEVRAVLRHLRDPLKLGQSPWLKATAVASYRQDHPDATAEQALRALLDEALAQLECESCEDADLLRGRYWEGRTVQQMLSAERPQILSERHFYNQQARAIERLASLLAAREQACRADGQTRRLLGRLPLPSYDRLFGVEAIVGEMLHHLQGERDFILSLKGIGGIGKTSLADCAVRTYLQQQPRLADVVWISAKQEYLTPSGIVGAGIVGAGIVAGEQTQIRLESIFDELGRKLDLSEVARLPLAHKVERLASTLRTAPHLVVIDNLETVADFQRLVPWLMQLAAPTHFLLTSRQTVPALTQVQTLELAELDRPSSLALIEHVAREKSVTDLDASDVYALTGGNPLAVQLVVSQMSTLPVDAVLGHVRTGAVEEMYAFIYRNAWSALSDAAKALLLAIQRAGDVADWLWLTTVSDLPEPLLRQALGELFDLSLVQPQRSGKAHTFAIHRLTSTFLCTEVLGWK